MSFPGGSVIKNPPPNAGDIGSISGLGRAYRATKSMQHIYWAHVPENHAQQQEKPPQCEACTLQLECSPCLAQLEQSPRRNEDLAQTKRNKIISKKVTVHWYLTIIKTWKVESLKGKKNEDEIKII